MCEIMDGQLGLFDPDSSFGKTYPEHSVAEIRKEQTSQPSSKKSSKSQSRMPVCKCLYPTVDGAKPGVITLKMVDGALLGDFTMHSFGESHREENASLLSQILEDSAPQKYSLSAKACDGILRRAEKRGKELPKVLHDALVRQSSLCYTEDSGRC